MRNLFSVIADAAVDERVELLARGEHLRIERIVSKGHASPPEFWYDQEMDEWVCLLQGHAELSFEQGESKRLFRGDWLFLPAGQRHRVESTSIDPPCIWLAVHGRFDACVKQA